MARRRSRPSRRLLGVDLGERWIGVAGTDDTGVLASPITTIDLRKLPLSEVARIADEREAGGIVVGLPKTMSGKEGYQAEKARAQAAELQESTKLPVIFWDERLTTSMAEQIAARSKRRGRQRLAKADAVAAAVLLQSYIDAVPFRQRGREIR